MKLVDKNGFPSSIGPKGVRVLVTPHDSLSGSVSSPRGGKKNASGAKKDLSKKATHNPEIAMPKFSLDSKIQGELQRDGDGASSGKSPGRAEKERAARVAREGVPLVVRAEASDLDIASVSAAVRWWASVRPALPALFLCALAKQRTFEVRQNKGL